GGRVSATRHGVNATNGTGFGEATRACRARACRAERFSLSSRGFASDQYGGAVQLLIGMSLSAREPRGRRRSAAAAASRRKRIVSSPFCAIDESKSRAPSERRGNSFRVSVL